MKLSRQKLYLPWQKDTMNEILILKTVSLAFGTLT